MIGSHHGWVPKHERCVETSLLTESVLDISQDSFKIILDYKFFNRIICILNLFSLINKHTFIDIKIYA